MRKLPIGIQGFEKLRTEGCVYVDKTAYVYQLAHQSAPIFLSRPRRFGKSLFLSALKAYWEGRKELFHGLAVERMEEDNPEAWTPHPVFYFDFNGVNYQENTALEDMIDEQLRRLEKQYGIPEPIGSLEERFRSLLIEARRQSGRKCVVLVDEYDKPLLEVMANPALEEHNKAVFKGFFGTLKGFDDYLRFVFITGVTKFSKVSIFSDLNQMMDISLDERYAGICGITEDEMLSAFEPELLRIAQRRKISSEACVELLRRTYDGYHFSSDLEAGVYNPFSLLNVLEKQRFGSYWFETGTPIFLVRKLEEMHFDPRNFTDRTLLATEEILSDYRGDNPDPVPLLYQTGYLTIKDYEDPAGIYTLGFPNEEVKYGFLNSLMPAYAPQSANRSGKDILSIRRYVQTGDLDSLKDALTGLFAGIPYTDERDPFEHYFQAVLYLVFTLLGQYTKTEIHSFKGRADCVVETERFIYLFEFKRDRTAAEALRQIEKMEYALPYAADPRKLYKIGASFDSDSRMLTEWKVK